MEDIVFYGFCLLMIVIGFYLIKRVVSCLFRSAIALIVIAILAYVYFAFH